MLGGSSGINAIIYLRASAGTTTVGPPKAPPAGPGMTCCPTSSAARPTNAWARRCMAKTAPACQRSAQRQPLPATLARRRRQCGHAINTDFNGETQEGLGLLPDHSAPWRALERRARYLRPQVGVRANLRCAARCRCSACCSRAGGRWASRCEGGFAAPPARPARGGAGGQGHPVAAVADVVGRGAGAPAGAGPARAAPPARRRRQPARPSGLRLRLRIRRPQHPRHLACRQRPIRTRRGALPPRAARPLAGNIAEAGGFLRTSPAHTTPNIQLHLLVALVENHARRLHWGHGITCHVCVLRPKSRGSVRLASPRAGDSPLIDPAFFQHPTTCRSSSRGC